MWSTLPRPYLMLAPMADVTDAAFRHIIATYGKPDVLWTEFVSADGLYHTREVQRLPDAENPLMRDLVYAPEEHPIVAQLFSSNPAMIAYGARLVADLGFDGVDLNMGCPDQAVERQGAGAALMKDPARARELIRATKEAVGERIPVSVKTRIGYRRDDLATWLPELLKEEPAAITIHARTRAELSEVPARWEHVQEAVSIRNTLGSTTHIIGNGDVVSLTDARDKAAQSGADGVMVGRGIFGNPWFFRGYTPTLDERLAVLAEHCTAFETLVPHKSFAVMRKHFKAYVHGFDGASELRARLMACENAAEVAEVIRGIERHRPLPPSSP